MRKIRLHPLLYPQECVNIQMHIVILVTLQQMYRNRKALGNLLLALGPMLLPFCKRILELIIVILLGYKLVELLDENTYTLMRKYFFPSDLPWKSLIP